MRIGARGHRGRPYGVRRRYGGRPGGSGEAYRYDRSSRVPSLRRATIQRPAHGGRLRSPLPPRGVRAAGGMTDRLPSDDVLIGEHYYILASSVAADLPKLVLKHDDAFLVADRRGDFPNVPGEFGFYVGDTRFLSLLELRLHGLRGIALNAGVSDNALEAAIDLTNPDMPLRPHVVLPGRSMRLARRLTIYGQQLYHWMAV